jgi:hypothetical protein
MSYAKNLTVDIKDSDTNIMPKGPQLAHKGPPLVTTIIGTGIEEIKHYILGVGLKVHVESVVWLVTRRLIVDLVEASLQGSKVQRFHLVPKMQHPQQVPQDWLMVQEEVPVQGSRVHGITVNRLATEKLNVLTSSGTSEILPMLQLIVVFQTLIQRECPRLPIILVS